MNDVGIDQGIFYHFCLEYFEIIIKFWNYLRIRSLNTFELLCLFSKCWITFEWWIRTRNIVDTCVPYISEIVRLIGLQISFWSLPSMWFQSYFTSPFSEDLSSLTIPFVRNNQIMQTYYIQSYSQYGRWLVTS